MARQRKNIVRLDGDFVAKVERLASGGVAGFGARSRTRRTTLEDVAKDIVAEAQRLTDLPARRGRNRDRGGLPGRKAGYDFRKAQTVGERGYGTYRSSFKTDVVNRGKDIIVVAFNNNKYAGDVEFGNRRFGSRLFAKRAKRIAIPITKSKYNELQKSRNLSRSERKSRGWQSASNKYQRDYRKLVKQRGGPSTKSPAGRVSGARSFAALDENNKAWLFTRSVRTRDGYKILRRAMRNVARRKFG